MKKIIAMVAHKINSDGSITITHSEGAYLIFKRGEFTESQIVMTDGTPKPDALNLARIMREIGDYAVANLPDEIGEV